MTKKENGTALQIMSIRDIKRKSKSDMKNKYGFAMLATILLSLVSIGSVTLGLGVIFIAGAVQCCKKAFYVDIASNRFKGTDSIYRGFSQFLRALVANIYIVLIYAALVIVVLLLSRVVAMSGFVFILAGIVVAIVFSVKLKFVFYVMNYETELSSAKCIRRSWQLTKGHFWKTLGLELSFIGWYILIPLTFGILSLYVMPYKMTAEANLYLELSGRRGEIEAEQRAQSGETAVIV